MTKFALYLSLCLFFLFFTCLTKKASEASSNHISVAFYNLDNLFDDIDDTDHNDNDFTPNGKFKWTRERYQLKLKNMEKVIAVLVEGELPDVLGVCELESKKALKDLSETGKLKGNYSFIHYDSPDERGIDVAMLYNKSKFKFLHSENIQVVLTNNLNDKTRNQLYVQLVVKSTGDTMHFYVCHFPSRKEGKDKSEINRIDAAKTCKSFLNSHVRLNHDNLILLGDFNDEPWDKSLNIILGATDIIKQELGDLNNLMWHFRDNGRGTYKYKNEMNTLDQFMVGKALLDGKNMEVELNTVNILDSEWLKQKGKYKGYPLRTFGGNKWLNGYSDHFAIYMKVKW